MANGKKQAQIAAAAVMRVLDAPPTESCIAAAAEIIELALHDAAREEGPGKLLYRTNAMSASIAIPPIKN
jgi:hypothetical protein